MAAQGPPLQVLAEIKDLLQEQHDRVARCFGECMSGHDKILQRILAHQDASVLAMKLESQPLKVETDAGLRSLSQATGDHNALPDEALIKEEFRQVAPGPHGTKATTESSPHTVQNGVTAVDGADHDLGPDDQPRLKSLASLEMDKLDSMQREAAEHRVKLNSAEQDSDNGDKNRCQILLEPIVQHARFEGCILIVIVTNALCVGVETQYMAANQTEKSPLAFNILAWLHGLVFLVELILRLICEGRRFFRSRQWAWNWFDMFLVLISLFEFSLDVLAMGADVQNTNIMRTVRLIRVLRLSRITRLTRIVRFVSALHMMVESIIATLRSLLWIMALMLMILYVCGIMFTQGTSSHLAEEPGDAEREILLEFWGDLWTSMFTLFKSVTGGISWHEVVHPLMQINLFWVGLFIAYVSFIYFAVLNVVTGFFCNSAIEHAQREPHMLIDTLMKDRKWYEESLQKLFSSLDSDHSGHLDIREMNSKLEDPAVRAWFAGMGLEVDDAWTLFKLIDKDHSHDVNVPEFVHRCFQLRGNARGIDLELLRQEQKITSKKVWQMADRIEKEQKLATSKVLNMTNNIEMLSMQLRMDRLQAQTDRLQSQRDLQRDLRRLEQCMVSDLFKDEAAAIVHREPTQ